MYTVNEDDGDIDICVDSGVTEGFETDLVVFFTAVDGKAGEFAHIGS